LELGEFFLAVGDVGLGCVAEREQLALMTKIELRGVEVFEVIIVSTDVVDYPAFAFEGENRGANAVQEMRRRCS
jgi:hypothetical protein